MRNFAKRHFWGRWIFTTFTAALLMPALSFSGTAVNTRTDRYYDYLQAAVDDPETRDCDTLLLSGTFRGAEAQVIVTKNLTFKGSATLDGANSLSQRVVTIPAAIRVTLINLVIKNGPMGGIFNSGDLTLKGVAISHNSADHGAGIYSYGEGSHLCMRSCRVSCNRAQDFGGGVLVADYGSCALQRCSIKKNRAYGTTYPGGGGIDLFQNSDATLDECSICDNVAYNGIAAGAVWIAKFSTLLMKNCKVENNCAIGDKASGGIWMGFYEDAQSKLTLIQSSVEDNRGEVVGGIYINLSSAVIAKCSIMRNSACSEEIGFGGGGVHIASIDGYELTIHKTEIEENRPLDIVIREEPTPI